MPILHICACGTLVERKPCADCKRQQNRRHNNAPTRKAHGSKQHARVKRIVRARDPHHCIDCGTTHDLTIDYEVPLIAGGKMHQDNAVLRCRPCNSSRGGSLSRGGRGFFWGDAPTPPRTSPREKA